MQAPRESYSTGDPISRGLAHVCGFKVQVTVDEWGQMWEYCVHCRTESAVSVQRPKGFRRYDQRDRLTTEMVESVRIAKLPVNRKYSTRKGGVLPINVRKIDPDDL